MTMKKKLLFCGCLLASLQLWASVSFDAHFVNKTLRVDYLFSGDVKQQQIALDELCSLPQWAGRRTHLDTPALAGNGQVVMRSLADGQVLYAMAFSSLFQEWLLTEEAKHQARSFENTFLLPFPKQKVEIEVSLSNNRHQIVASYRHVVDPADILIRSKGQGEVAPHRYMWKGGAPEKAIDVAILAEGYTADEMEAFYSKAAETCEALFAHQPFGELKDRFNVVAVGIPSADSGVSVPRKKEWKQTVVQSHFDTFYSERYLTTTRVKAVHDALATVPYEHIIILANTDVYGGGGIYNAFTLTTANHPMFKPVVVHEFGHSFGGLADEYFYASSMTEEVFPQNIEPWEPNITTLVDFDKKWKTQLVPGTPVPTPIEQHTKYPIGVYEGAGYVEKGVYRPAENCRMRTNTHPGFCPTCQAALRRLIEIESGRKGN